MKLVSSSEGLSTLYLVYIEVYLSDWQLCVCLSSWNLHQYLVYTQLLYLSDWSYWSALWCLSSWNLHQYLVYTQLLYLSDCVTDQLCGFELLKPSHAVSSVYSVVPVRLKLLISSVGLSSWNLHQYLVYTQLLYLSDWSYWSALDGLAIFYYLLDTTFTSICLYI